MGPAQDAAADLRGPPGASGTPATFLLRTPAPTALLARELTGGNTAVDDA
jgi:hypothetical protein